MRRTNSRVENVNVDSRTTRAIKVIGESEAAWVRTVGQGIATPGDA